MTTATTFPPADRYKMPPAPVRRFTVDEYHQMIEDGYFAHDERFELLEGWIIPQMPRDPVHDATVSIATKYFDNSVPKGWHVRPQCALTLPPDGEPEPDLTIVRGDPADYSKRHPTPADTALVIEVANTSLDSDREFKGLNYARAAVDVYWIINLVDWCVDVYTEPTPATGQYRQDHRFGLEQSIPLSIGAQILPPVAVRSLLPPR